MKNCLFLSTSQIPPHAAQFPSQGQKERGSPIRVRRYLENLIGFQVQDTKLYARCRFWMDAEKI